MSALNGGAPGALTSLPDLPPLPNGSSGRRNLKCMKYSLMVINSFGVLLGFFIVLFGLAYKDASFPGGYSGRHTAILAVFFIFFSVIGYCGAAQGRNIFLIPYVICIIIGMVYNFFTWATSDREGGCLDPKSLSMSGMSILLLMLAAGLVFKLRRAGQATPTATSMDSMEKSSTTRSTSSMIATSKGKK